MYKSYNSYDIQFFFSIDTAYCGCKMETTTSGDVGEL